MASSKDGMLAMQKGVRDSSEELQNFLRDLNNWEKEMKYKDKLLQDQVPDVPQVPPVRSAKKRDVEVPKSVGKVKRVSSTDYKSWDKFDADKECQLIDENKVDDEDNAGDVDMSDAFRKQKALVFKDKGNLVFKKGKWDESIRFYSKGLQCDPHNIHLLANRAMAYLKLEKYEEVIADTKKAIELDPTYLKCYLRRSSARLALKQYDLALSDINYVLSKEPSNEQAVSLVSEIQKYVKKNDKQLCLGKETSENQDPIQSCNGESKLDKTPFPTKVPKQVAFAKEKFNFPVIPMTKPCVAVSKPACKMSSQPLRKVPIKRVKELDLNLEKGQKKTSSHQNTHAEFPKVETKHTDERTEQKSVDISNWPAPKNCSQFEVDWKQLKGDRDLQSRYLTKILPSDIPKLFGENLDSPLFSEIIHVLSLGFPANNYLPLPYLKAFTHVKRFQTIVMFLSKQDQKELKNMLCNCMEDSTDLLLVYGVS